jgi:hypothetical protein
MTYFVVEHGDQIIETITGVEDIDITMYPKFKTLWVCDSPEEVLTVENELRRRHERPSK